MEAQLHRTTDDHHRYEEDPHHNVALPSGMEGEGETEHNHHGEKKSVLKKVKDKAKKIKDKIKHSGHAHDEEEYDDEDEETVIASGGHAAPIVNEDAFISGTNLPKQTGLNLGNQTTPLEDLQNPSVIGHAGVRDPHGHNTRNEVHPSIGNDPVLIGNAGVKDPQGHNTRNEVHPSIGNDPVLIGNAGVRDPHSPNMRTEVHPGIGDDPVFKTSAPMEVDHPYNPDIVREHAYSSAGDVGSGPGKMARLPMEAPKTDLWDPLPASTAAIDSEPQRVNVAEPMAKIGPMTDLEKDPHAPGGFSPPNYQTKVVDPTGRGGAEAEVAPLVERLGNLHVDDKSEEKSYTGSHDQFAPEPTPINEQERSYTGSHDQFAPELTPINEQERSYTGSHDQFAPELTPINEQERSYMGSQFAPEPTPTEEQCNLEAKSFDAESPESMPRDTVAGKISAATSLIADKASSAKNMVASKLGYGSDQSQEAQEPRKTTALGSVSEYGYKVAEKLAPVYDKAAGAGSAIMSKVQGGGGEGVVAKESDKGVSVQEYLAEKFSPGDEDKELSKVITDAIHRKKERAAETGEDEAEAVPVKETIRIEAVASNEKAAAGVVDRVKGAIGSWLGKSPGEGIEKEEVSRVQEAGN